MIHTILFLFTFSLQVFSRLKSNLEANGNTRRIIGRE